jgi:hypothetical protein
MNTCHFTLRAWLGTLLLSLWFSAPAFAQDGFEPDNTALEAVPLLNGVTDPHSIHQLYDEDWSVFVVGPGGARDINVALSAHDVMVWLMRGSDMAALGYDDLHDGGAFDFVGITVASLEPGTYYTLVKRHGSAGTIPAYTIRVSWKPRDVYESDDSIATAKIISNRQAQNRSIDVVGDEDWAKFTIPSGGARNIQINSSFDTQLWLYRGGDMQELAYDSANGAGDDSIIQVATLPAGAYFIRVRDYGNDDTIQDYQLYADWTVGAIGPDAYEADNTRAVAKAIRNGRAQDRTIHAPGGEDWAKMTVGPGGARNLQIDAGSYDVQVWLYRGQESDSIGYADPHYTGNRVIALSTLQAGTYYIKITGHSPDATAPYRLSTRWTQIVPPDRYESDNRRSTAKRIRNGRTQNRTIHRARNRDWAKFTIGAAGARNLKVETRGASGDTQLWLYNRAGRRVAFDDDSGRGRFSRIRRSSLAAGTYYIRAQEKGNDGTIPAYTLRATWTNP